MANHPIAVDPATLGVIGAVIALSVALGVILGASIAGGRAQHRSRRNRPAETTGGRRLVADVAVPRPPDPVATHQLVAATFQLGAVRHELYQPAGVRHLDGGERGRWVDGPAPVGVLRAVGPAGPRDRGPDSGAGWTRPPRPFPVADRDPGRAPTTGGLR